MKEIFASIFFLTFGISCLIFNKHFARIMHQRQKRYINWEKGAYTTYRVINIILGCYLILGVLTYIFGIRFD
jgi:hypothetical protein